GASGRLGLQALQTARGNGHVLAVVSTANSVSLPLIDPSFRIEPVKNYLPVINFLTQPFVLISSPQLPFSDAAGLLAYARTNPGKLNGAHTGPGSMAHLAWEQLKINSGLAV